MHQYLQSECQFLEPKDSSALTVISAALTSVLLLTFFKANRAAPHQRMLWLVGRTVLLVCCSHHVISLVYKPPCLVSNVGRRFSPVMYLEWMATTPMMILLMYRLSPAESIWNALHLRLQFLNATMIICGAIGSVFTAPHICLTAIFISFLCHLFLQYGEYVLVQSALNFDPELKALFWLNVVCQVSWASFPTVWIAGQLHLISDDLEECAYGVCDVIAKIISTALLAIYAAEQHQKHRVLRKLLLSEEEKREATYQLIRYIFHEVRVPLNSVALGLHNLNESETLDKETVRMMLGSTSSMSKILNDFLHLEKLNSKLPIEMNWIVQRELLLELYSRFQDWALQKNVRFSIVIQKNHPMLWGDKDRLLQVLSNLLSNALKFTKEGSIIVRSFVCQPEASAPYIRMEVQDSGVGIGEADRKKIFTPFTQINAGILQKGKGTGLGLVISRKLMHAMGGDIDVKSKEGSGATFFATLPLAKNQTYPKECVMEDLLAMSDSKSLEIPKDARVEKTPSADAPSSYAAARATQGQRRPSSSVRFINFSDSSDSSMQPINHLKEPKRELRVLLVDDVLANNKLLARLLQRRVECTCELAMDGKEAVDIIAKRGPGAFDLILMDNKMPLMNGTEATRRLRAMGFKNDIYAVTGDALEEDREKFMAAGANRVFIKPVNTKELVAIVFERYAFTIAKAVPARRKSGGERRKGSLDTSSR